MAEYTFKRFQAEYLNDAACLKRIMEIQYGGEETHCQVCDRRTQFHPMTKRRAYACQECGHHIYPCAGTIFHKSRTKLTIWFFAMYLMTGTRHGVAAKEIERQTGVTYKCAWRLCHELRKLMASAGAEGGRIGGSGKHVEADETLVGGRLRHHGKGKHRVNKTTVFGMVERDGRLIAGPVPDETKFTLEPIIRENVEPGTTTDGHCAYRDLGDGYDFGFVDRSAKAVCARRAPP
jgi:transposase